MADQNIKIVRIKKEDLPAINRNVQGYNLRYRIISEDKNRTSHWSSQIPLVTNYVYVTGNKNIAIVGQVANITWEPVKITKVVDLVTYNIGTESDYDVWVRWDKGDSGDWTYKQRVSGTSISLLKPSTYFINNVNQATPPTFVTVEIFLKGNPVSRSTSYLKAYTLGPQAI